MLAGIDHQGRGDDNALGDWDGFNREGYGFTRYAYERFKRFAKNMKLKIEEASTHRDRDTMGSIASTELIHDVAQMCLDGLLADKQ